MTELQSSVSQGIRRVIRQIGPHALKLRYVFAIALLLYLKSSTFSSVSPVIPSDKESIVGDNIPSLADTGLTFEPTVDNIVLNLTNPGPAIHSDSSRNQSAVTYGSASDRVAICICGAARTFHYEGVHQTILDTVVNPLRAIHQVDIFFIVRMEDDAGPSRPTATLAVNQTLMAMQKFQPVRIIKYTDMAPLNMSRYIEMDGRQNIPVKIEAPAHCAEQFNETEPRKMDLSHTLFRQKQCLETVQAHEAENRHVRYDWIYRIRTDMVLFDRVHTPQHLRMDTLYIGLWSPDDSIHFPAWWMERKKTTDPGGGPVGDQIAIASRSVAEVAFKAFDLVDDCEAYELPMLNIETGLRLYLAKHNVTYEAIHWLWTVVRDHTGALCYLSKFMHVRNTTEEQRMARCERFRLKYADKLPG